MEFKEKEVVADFLKKCKQFEGLFRPYQDTYLVIDKLTDKDTILLSILIIDNWVAKRGAGDLDALKKLFSYLGRIPANFWANRTLVKNQGLVDEEDGRFFVTMKGLQTLERAAGVIENTSIYIIEGGKNFTAIELFKDIIAKLPKADKLMLMDEYLSYQTLIPFIAVKGRFAVFNIITSNIYEDKKDLEAYIEKFKKETNIEVNIKISHKSHDRILIAGDKCFAIGSSIKDLGNKDTLITDISVIADSIKDLFEDRWAEADTYK